MQCLATKWSRTVRSAQGFDLMRAVPALKIKSEPNHQPRYVGSVRLQSERDHKRSPSSDVVKMRGSFPRTYTQ